MKKLSIFILLVSLFMFSCKKIIESTESFGKEKIKIEELKKINVNKEYSVAVPDYMTEMKSLNDDASFQYANLFKETYIVVLDEDKNEFINVFKEMDIYNDAITPLKNYSSFQLKSFKESIEAININSLESGIKKLPSEMHEFNGYVDGNNIAYLVSFIEAENKMYMIMSWTMKSRYNKYKETFKMIHNTFKVIK